MHAGRQIVRTRPYAAPWSGQCGVGREKHLQAPSAQPLAPNGAAKRAPRPPRTACFALQYGLFCNAKRQPAAAACVPATCAAGHGAGASRRKLLQKSRRPAGPSMAGAEHSRPRPRGTPRRAIGRQRRQGCARGPPTGENEGVKIVRNCRFATCLHENAPCQHDFPPHRPPFFVILPWSKTENKLLDYINILLNYFVLTSETVYYGYCIGSARAVGASIIRKSKCSRVSK